MEKGTKVRMYYPRLCAQYGFWEMPWIDCIVREFTRKGNPKIGIFIFDKDTLKCINITPKKERPERPVRYLKII